jgi:predicted TIM-barrel fold metal-dependent hydrolase
MMPVPLAFCIPFACTVDGIGEDNRVWGSDFPHPDERLAPLDQAGDAR